MTSFDDTRFNDGQYVRPARRGFGLDRENAKFAGVCAGIARWMNIDPLLVRIGFVAGTLLGFGAFILIYLAIWLVAD